MMTLKIKIISPIKIDEVDLRRRQIRYGEHASADSEVVVFNLPEGPETLDSPGDLLFCEHAVFQEGMRTDPGEFDAILIDCVFDPAVDALREQCAVPTFGPMRITLPMVIQVADKFSYVARAERQTQWLTEIATRYGYGDRLVSARALKISYQDSRSPKIFDKAMSKNLKLAVQEDGADAIAMIGSRLRRFGKNAVPIHRHNLPFVTLGVFILWFGWIGFNGWSTLGLTPDVPGIIVNTFISFCFAIIIHYELFNPGPFILFTSSKKVTNPV